MTFIGDLQELFRKSAVAELTKRLQGSLARANDAATADMDKLFEQQAELTRRERDISRGVESIQVIIQCLGPCRAYDPFNLVMML